MPRFAYSGFSHNFFEVAVKEKRALVSRTVVKILNKHTDLISSLGILAITTCLLAAKIFKRIPAILPRLALVTLNFGGIIWLNVQIRDFFKSCMDLQSIIGDKEWNALVETSAKVFVKAVNLLLTCTTFAASVIATVGFPQISLAMYLGMRPLALSSLAIAIGGDIRDYFVNQAVLKHLGSLEEKAETLPMIKVMSCFLNILKNPKCSEAIHGPEEHRMARCIVRQLDFATIETFEEGLAGKQRTSDSSSIEALKLFYMIKDSMTNKQAATKANLSLITLGYFSMGLCRAFPDTLIEMASRWSMSVLYTDELIRQKLFQHDLAGNLEAGSI